MKKLTFTLIFALLLNISAFAADAEISLTKLEVNPDTGVVVILGKLTPASSKREVVLRVIKPKMSLSDLGLLEDVLNRADQTMTTAAGEFEFNYTMTGAVGEYTLLISTDAADNVIERKLQFASPSVVRTVLDAVNNGINNKNLYNYLYAAYPIKEDDPKFILSLDTKLTAVSASLDFNKVCARVIERGKSYTKVADFVNDFVELAALEAISAGTSVSVVIGSFHTELGLDNLKLYQTYIANAALKSSVDAALSGKSYESANKFVEAFNEQTIVKYLYNIPGSGEVYGFLSANNDIIGLDFTEYNLLSAPDKSEVDKLMSGNNAPSSLVSAKNNFNAAVDQYSNVSQGPIGSNTPSGGGSVSGRYEITGGGGYQTPDLPSYSLYSDLGGVPWAESSIIALTNMGVLNGKAEGLFYPSDMVTRAEFAKMLCAALSLTDEAAECDFYDVKQSEWYYKYISSLSEKSVINGVGDGYFGVSQLITRQDIAALAYRAVKYLNKPLNEIANSDEFTDLYNISDYALEGVAAMQKSGIINGFEDGRFAPKQSATRAEAAKIIYGLINSL